MASARRPPTCVRSRRGLPAAAASARRGRRGRSPARGRAVARCRRVARNSGCRGRGGDAWQPRGDESLSTSHAARALRSGAAAAHEAARDDQLHGDVAGYAAGAGRGVSGTLTRAARAPWRRSSFLERSAFERRGGAPRAGKLRRHQAGGRGRHRGRRRRSESSIRGRTEARPTSYHFSAKSSTPSASPLTPPGVPSRLSCAGNF